MMSSGRTIAEQLVFIRDFSEIDMITISDDVYKLLATLNAHKDYGPYGIHTNIFRFLSDFTVSVFVSWFNFLRFFRAEESDDTGNYRHFSLLSALVNYL